LISSQINIDVNSAEFTALKAAFDRYEAAVRKMPAAWKNVGQASATTKTNFESMAGNMKVVDSSMAAIATSGKEFFQVTTATARHWHNLAISTGSVAKNILGATDSLLKWTGVVSLVTGGAGLFGFDRLAHSVASQRTAAMGTGGNYGARAAFLTNFRRFGDPEGLLGRIAEAQSSIKESVPLRLLGITPQDLKGDPTDVAIKVLRRAAQIAHNDTVPVGSDPRLALFTNAERIRLRDHPEEVEEMIARMRADQKSGRLNLSPADQKGYQDFTTRMEKASREIETIFVKGLAKLAGPLSELSDATVRLVDKFTDKALPDLVKDLGGAIDWLAKEVEKPSFVAAVEGLAGDIASLASSFGSMLGGLARFAHWLGVGTSAASSFGAGVTGVSGLTGAGGETSLEGRHGAAGAGGKRGFAARAGGSTWAGSTPENTAAAMAAAKDQLRKEGVPEANLDAAAAAMVGNAMSESRLNPRAVHDHGTGYGIYGARLERRTAMFDWLAAHGYAKDSLEGQMRQAVHSAMTDSKYRATRNALMRATDPNVAGDVVEHNFEAPKIENNRHAAFQKAYGARKSDVSIHAAPGGNASLSSGAAAAGSP
jgi:hypothetical protein